MNKATNEQLGNAVKQNDAFAITILGLLLINNGDTKDIIQEGIRRLCFAGDSKNCILAKNVIAYIQKNNGFEVPILEHVLVDDDAMEQLRIYSLQGNIWAMTAYGRILYSGGAKQRDTTEGAKFLNLAADKSCYLAEAYITELGIARVEGPRFGNIFEKLTNKDQSRYWLK